MQANDVIKELQDAGEIVAETGDASTVAAAADSLVAATVAADSTMLANADSAAAAGNSTLISQLDSTDASHVETDEQAMISKFPLFAKLRPVADEQGQIGRGPDGPSRSIRPP